MRISNWAGIAVMSALGMCAMAAQADCDWQLLGQRSVDRRADHDEIVVTDSNATFSGVQLRVQGAAVEFEKVTVHFRNGMQQELDMRDRIEAGGSTRTIDLQGQGREDRRITLVEFDYRADVDEDERAAVQLWGQT